MNQILVINNNLSTKKGKKYLYILSVSIIISILIILYLSSSFFIRFNLISKTNLLKNKYIITTLYSENNNYSTLKLFNSISIIGVIDIPKINISYPIVKESNDNLLKVSVCRFSGPLPNRIGNLCIAGHNYKNNSMFSKLYKLNVGDYIYITDLNNIKLEYIIYNKFIVNENNLDSMQSSNNVEVTLITCNNINNSERLVVKAKMKG